MSIVPVAPDLREVELVLAPEAAIFGHVRDAKGAAIEGYIEVIIAGQESGGARIEADGSFLVSALPQSEGLVTVTFEHSSPLSSNAGFAPKRVELVSGKTTPLDFTEQPDGG